MKTVGSRSFQETDYQRNSQQQQQQEEEKKQTIDSNTNNFPASSINRLEVGGTNGGGGQEEEEEEEAKNKGCNNIGDLEELRNKQLAFGAGEGAESLSFPAGACDAKSPLEENRLIDSRSILTNKAKLKRYWERKMEMEFKLKQPEQQQQQQMANGHANKQQLLVIDENNNDPDDDDRHESSVAFSDEEWRSLSPNVDPRCVSSNKLASTTATSGCEETNGAQEHELICKKLLQFQEEQKKEALVERPLIVAAATGSEQTQQPMSLDPTLCHPESGPEVNQQTATITLNGEEVSPNDREEQTANEEFSSSNSSFGPMSISMPARQLPVKVEATNLSSLKSESANEDEDEEEEAESSAQSGSVLTVITKLDGSPEEPTGAEPEAEDKESNIGVAFESLQFDSEIKSSREEKVDESQFLQQPPVAKRQNGFTKREVNSVCNFITSAISDATRQVESFMSRKQEESPFRREDNDDSSTILRATFVESSPQELSLEYQGKSCTDDDLQKEPKSEQEKAESDHEEEEEEEEEEAPKTDLSSIFEANVRREIQRFESGGGVGSRRASTGKSTSGSRSNLTEWRIAEEIRLFNERELELKQRHGSSCSSNSSKQNSASNLASVTCQQNQKRSQQTETVVRFGKALQIPKAVPGEPAGSGPLHLSKAIKLTTTTSSCANQQPANMISMHKFISSGGKRFVLTTSSTNNNNNSTASNSLLQHQSHLTKSMSNLSSSSSSRQVDYKAADSLNFKECPNVKPGITRKAIETFRRLNDVQLRVPSELSSSKTTISELQSCQVSSSSSNVGQSLSSSRQQFSSCHQATNQSAEFKIQEELREMRAREAELRSQRSHSIGSASSIGQTQLEPFGASNRKSALPSSELELSKSQETREKEPESFSQESLYPIKQAIDSFRKLNSAAQQSKVPTSKRQQIGDYEARVGGERRKISMIEKWENGIGGQS